MDMLTLLAAIALVGLVFVGFAVKILLKKNGEFVGTCASNSPFLNKEGVTCDVCGKEVTADTVCDEEKEGGDITFEKAS